MSARGKHSPPGKGNIYTKANGVTLIMWAWATWWMPLLLENATAIIPQ